MNKLAQCWISGVLAAAVGLLAGCGQPAPKEPAAGAPGTGAAASVRVVKHELGETKPEGTPQRVVALEFSFADALATVGVTPVGIADDGDASNIIDPIKQKIGKYTSLGSRYEVNFELIAWT